MIKNIRSIKGEKIIHFETGEALGILNLPIIDPDTGVIEAFWIKPLTLPLKNAIILTSDILAFKKNIYVESEKSITIPEQILKISSILDDGRQFLFSPLKNEKGKSYGSIYNLSFSTETYVIRQLFSKRSLLRLISLGEWIFPYERVIKVLPKVVIIDDDTTKKEKVLSGPAELA